jgi:hypothetical protein
VSSFDGNQSADTKNACRLLTLSFRFLMSFGFRAPVAKPKSVSFT